MPTQIPRYKGTKDLLPEDMARFRHIEEVFRRHCLLAGYEEVRTPSLEYLHLFTAAGTLSPDQLHRLYSFLDWDGWSGERVALRPDGTIPTARLYTEALHSVGEVAKLFYVQNVFALQAEGENRERWQCGVELLGGDRRAGEVDLLLLARDILSALALGPVEIRLSHVGLLHALASPGTPGKPQPGEQLSPLALQLEGQGPGFLANLQALAHEAHPGALAPLEELAALSQLLSATGCPHRIHLGLASSFEYYTGPVFHLFCAGQQVGAGGRYDALIPLIGGPPVPAAGFALYLESLLSRLDGPLPRPPRLLVRPSGASTIAAAYHLAQQLRREGWEVEVEVGPRREERFRWVVKLENDSAHCLVEDRESGQGGSMPPGEILAWLTALKRG